MDKAGICLMLSMLIASFAAGQSAHELIRKGNKAYHKGDFADAEADYKKALQKQENLSPAWFNLGNAMYQQQRYDEARKQYQNSLQLAQSPQEKADAWYNMGNTWMSEKNWQQSIQTYKQALKLNPADNDARYNLAYAQAMLKKQQQQQSGGKQNQQQNKNNQNQQQQQNQQNQQHQSRQQPQHAPGQLTPQQADQLLKALAQQEQKIREKKNENQPQQPIPGGKDW